MGCTASRVENEDTVRRCRERRRFMKEAVHSRHHLASAHSDYLRSLRLAAAALTRFARGEALAVSEHAPPVLLHSSAAASSFLPPPPRFFSSSSFAPSPSRGPQLSHVRRFSNSAETRFRKPSPAAAVEHFAAENPAYPVTPSHSSSAWSTWDWQNFYPPSPPDSEFFDRRKAELEEKYCQQKHHLPPEVEEVGGGGGSMREELHCHEWGEHYSSSSSSSSRSDGELEDEEEDKDSRSTGIATRSGYDGASEPSRMTPINLAPSAAVRSRQWARLEAGSSSAQWNAGRELVSYSATAADEIKMVVRHRNLVEIVAALEEYFIKAAAAGDAVSNLLETGHTQNLSHLKKTVYHSNSMLNSLSSSWTSKPPLAVRYQLDAEAMELVGGKKSHCSTLERLLAWETKLYEEVKAREGVKIEHEKKLSTLQSLEYRRKLDSKLDKTKASINKLQSLIIVTSQAVTTTSSAIMEVCDNDLAPQLVEMCYNLLNMWRQMNQYHEAQNHIVQQVRGLVNHSSKGESTSDLHRLATRDLEAAISTWHSSFNRLIKYQRDYINALYGWLKLTLLQVSSDNPLKDHSYPLSIALTGFCDEWKQALDRVPEKVASEAIKSFMNVIHVIYTKQTEELKIKKRAETYSKELEKKSTALRNIEKKYYRTYSMVGIGFPSTGHEDDAHVLDACDPLAEKKLEIAACRRKVEDEMTKHAKAVEVTRSMTLNNIQTGLPGVFQAITGFSGVFVEALEGVCRRAGSI
ncbi:hypothetical protein Cni_G16357 [Canna indica]|uniref:Uncharacterized protein n=1 Tax=Canna indica TaxID=4628 RepID=A0AAQ3KIJ3_9LILI|nr:hypothetical protein Cni_G16357 [Canna indica]